MKRWTLLLWIPALGIWQTAALGNCPAGYLNEIFCDDFDTYCATGGYPGDPHCTPDPPDNSVNNVHLREVWPRTSTTENNDALCGVEVKAEDTQALINSAPLGCRFPKGDLGQVTLRDWTLPGQVLDLHRFIGNVFGSQYAAVAATDSAPLAMEFFMGTDTAGKLYFSSGFMELGYGDPTDHLNRANTEYANSPDCNTFCSPTIGQPPSPIVCAQGNPIATLPAACPSVATAPIHQAVAVGALSVVDPDPCHCGPTASHFSQNTHLTLFDGKVWWTLKTGGVPMPSSGTVTPTDGGPADPADLVPGNFVLSGTGGTKSYNLVRLTIKGSTLKIECTSFLKSSNGFKYDVYNVMDNIPRKYTGQFDRVSMGVGPGCELASNASWDTCKSGTDRACLPQRGTFYVDFDDFVLFGGTGFAINGACCHSNGTCDVLLPAECQAPGDVHGGSNTDCDTTLCCPHGTYVWADSDADGDVDADDFAAFQLCYTGSGGPMSADSKCQCFNREGNDNDVDGSDYQQFMNCASGANVPWAPGSPASCVP